MDGKVADISMRSRITVALLKVPLARLGLLRNVIIIVCKRAKTGSTISCKHIFWPALIMVLLLVPMLLKMSRMQSEQLKRRICTTRGRNQLPALISLAPAPIASEALQRTLMA